jgi:hypothetical protein
MQTKTCKICANIFLKPAFCSKESWGRRTFCSRKCWGVFLGQSRIGLPRNFSKETLQKIHTSRSGSKHHFYGKSFSKTHKMRLSIAGKGRKISDNQKAFLSHSRQGAGNPMYGKTVSTETRQKLSLANRGKNSGTWRGGFRKTDYSQEWTEFLKESIRIRDGHVCQVCGAGRGLQQASFDVHHIDYNKKNCNPDNLITLCHNCHSRTNFNRASWIKLLTLHRAFVIS